MVEALGAGGAAGAALVVAEFAENGVELNAEEVVLKLAVPVANPVLVAFVALEVVVFEPNPI